MEMPWPDEPMQHGYADAGMDGLKEYQGDADEIVASSATRRSSSLSSRRFRRR